MTKIIAEFSHNHLGREEILNSMIGACQSAGVWGCKIQTFFADDLTPEWKEHYLKVKEYELSWERQEKFVKKVKESGMTPMTSVYTTKYLPHLSEIGFRHIKIGSPHAHLTDMWLKYVIAGFKVFLSTGGHDLIKLKPFLRTGLECIFHCNSQYPTPVWNANLLRMLEIKRLFPGAKYGYSSHLSTFSENEYYKVMALSCLLGASYIETHFTMLPKDKTKDGAVSVNQTELEKLVNIGRQSKEELLEHCPQFGALYSPAPKEEIELIEKYKGRFLTS